MEYFLGKGGFPCVCNRESKPCKPLLLQSHDECMWICDWVIFHRVESFFHS